MTHIIVVSNDSIIRSQTHFVCVSPHPPTKPDVNLLETYIDFGIQRMFVFTRILPRTPSSERQMFQNCWHCTSTLATAEQKISTTAFENPQNHITTQMQSNNGLSPTLLRCVHFVLQTINHYRTFRRKVSDCEENPMPTTKRCIRECTKCY